MSVGYVLQIAGGKIGLNPNDAQERAVLLRFLNEAANELYTQTDIQLMEQVFKVNGDQTISLPAYVKDLRAVREFNSYIPWHINQLRPRYNIANWKDIWRNWRLKGRFALQRTISNQAAPIVIVNEVETPNIVVTIGGPTVNAQYITEIVTCSTLENPCANSYLDIGLLRKDRSNNTDVILKDIDGNQLSLIPNNMLEAEYTIVDVSMLPWMSISTSQQDHYVEILYKPALMWLQNDGDEFPAKDIDNILVNKILQLWKEEQDKGEAAALYDAKATRSLARRHEDENRATEDQVCFATNGHDELLAKIRTNRPGRQTASIYPFGIQ